MKNNNFYVYELLRSDEKDIFGNFTTFYVGKGCGTRAEESATTYGSCKSPYKKNIINKLKKEKKSPIIYIVAENLTEEKAFELEKKLIKFYGRKIDNLGPLSNMTLGGEGQLGRKQSEETKQKLREIQLKKENHHFYKKGPDSVNWGRKLTEEHKLKIKKTSLGRKHTEESKKKLSEKRIGNKNPMFGKATHNSQAVIVDDIEYRSCSEAGKIIGVKYSTIKRRALNNNFPNYKFKGEINNGKRTISRISSK